ncbi:MAG TPA: hypothetical protein VNJ12_10805 [Candidatus Dormibacteraeota bacterium]|nr:hypothetical protein [Stellaceae bacterium]HVB99804.1 hypothetical protein [Candidatus Dormibacteraeota bacterium]
MVRPIGALLLEQNGEWAAQRARYMSLETTASLESDDPDGQPPGPGVARPEGHRTQTAFRRTRHPQQDDARPTRRLTHARIPNPVRPKPLTCRMD